MSLSGLTEGEWPKTVSPICWGSDEVQNAHFYFYSIRTLRGHCADTIDRSRLASIPVCVCVCVYHFVVKPDRNDTRLSGLDGCVRAHPSFTFTLWFYLFVFFSSPHFGRRLVFFRLVVCIIRFSLCRVFFLFCVSVRRWPVQS